MTADAGEHHEKGTPMTKQTALATFRLGDVDLEADPLIKEPYNDFESKRWAFGDALRHLNEATKKLHDLLDGPLRSAGLIPEGREWTLKDDKDDGLVIQVWSEPKQRGKRKAEVPLKRLALRSQIKGSKAA